LDVWANEREVVGLKASLSTLTYEVQHMYKLCAEWKEAEDSLRKKWKKIKEFDAHRLELECIYSALQRANMVSVQSPDEQALAYVATSYGIVLVERTYGYIVIDVLGERQR
jgi:hypothetical protein